MRSPRTATKSSPHSPQLEKAHKQQQRPSTAKKKKKKKKFAICLSIYLSHLVICVTMCLSSYHLIYLCVSITRYLAIIYLSNLSNLCIYLCMFVSTYVPILVFGCSYTHMYAHITHTHTDSTSWHVTPEPSSGHLQKIREIFLHNHNTMTTSKKMYNNSLI